MLTPAERDRAHRFAMWLRGDQEANEPPVQLSLLTDTGDPKTPADTRETTHPGDPDGLESIGSIMARVLAELYAKHQAAA